MSECAAGGFVVFVYRHCVCVWDSLVWVCVCVGFVMYGCVYVCGYCNVWMCVSFVTCGCVYVCGFCNVWMCLYVWVL